MSTFTFSITKTNTPAGSFNAGQTPNAFLKTNSPAGSFTTSQSPSAFTSSVVAFGSFEAELLAKFNFSVTKTLTPSGLFNASMSPAPFTGNVSPTSSFSAVPAKGFSITKTLTPAASFHSTPSKAILKAVAPTKFFNASLSVNSGFLKHVPSSAFFSAGVGGAPCNLTLFELRQRVWDILEDDGSYYTAAEVRRALNAAENLFALITLCLERTFSFTLTNGQAFQDLTSALPDGLCLLSVYFGATRLFADTIDILDQSDSAWRNTAGNPQRYIQMGFLQNGVFAVTPQPAIGTNTLTITAAVQPAGMVGDFDVPSIPGDQQIYLPDIAIGFLQLKVGGQELANAQEYVKRGLSGAQKYQSFVLSRSRAQLYDTMPLDLSRIDMSRFDLKLRGQKGGKPPGGN